MKITIQNMKPWADSWDELTIRQKEIARAVMVNPNASKAELMRLLHIPERTFYREWNRIKDVFHEYFNQERPA